GKWCVSGRFAVVLQRIENVAEFNNGSGGGFGSSSGGPALSLPTGGHGARMSVLLLAEPGVAVARFPSELDIDTFIDEVDQKIEAGSEPRQPFSNARTAGTLRNLTLPLTLPERPGHTIVLLRGTANVLVAKKVEHIAVDPPAMAVTKQINGMNIEISPLVKQGTNSYQTKVLISRGELDADLWEKASRALDDLHVVVEDLGGQSMQMSQRNERTADSITISGNVFSSSNGTPGQIVLDIPTVLQEVKVPFEFKNLVLP
ncbi:MAG TPA: hypothetical protein VHM90_04485, partial [Phycisphaerae bacterium]|nr:hypothetical protein [Phycisphaerae bacterium]